MWDGDAGPNQISEGLEYQTAELELLSCKWRTTERHFKGGVK